MTDNKILQFFEKYSEISYKKGEKILRPNEYFGHVYLIKSGYIRIYKVLKTGQEITFNWYNPGLQKVVLFGYTQLLAHYHVEAISDVVIQRVPKADFRKFADENPEVKDRIIEDLMIFFTESLKQVEWLSIPDAYTRIKVMLYTFAQRSANGKTDKNDKLTLDFKFTHQLIASFTGLTRETVTIQINKLISQGYISRKDSSIVFENINGFAADTI